MISLKKIYINVRKKLLKNMKIDVLINNAAIDYKLDRNHKKLIKKLNLKVLPRL